MQMKIHLPTVCRLTACLILLTFTTAAFAGQAPGLADVVSTAESFSGQPARGATLEDRDGVLYYRVTTAGPDGGLALTVDPASGKVLDADPDFMLKWISKERVLPMDDRDDKRGGLARAIRAAERRVGGQALKADYRKQGANGVYTVDVLSGRRVETIDVDAASGRVIDRSLAR